MSITHLDPLGNEANVDLSAHTDTSPVHNGLYFLNLNRDKSVRILASRSAGLKDVSYVNQHPHILDVDDNTRGICLSPRPALNISCTGASSDVAIELDQSKTYKVILGGQTIATAANPSQLEALLTAQGLRVAFFARPTIFNCASYALSNRFALPVVVEDTSGEYLLKITDADGDTITSQVLTYGGSNFSSGAPYNISGVIASSVISAKTYLLNFNLVFGAGQAYNPNWKISVEPVGSSGRILKPEEYASYGYIPAQNAHLPTLLDGVGYWCITVNPIA